MSSKTYVGIVMVGAAPRFYKITITQDLVYAVSYGQFPAKETIVQHLVPPVLNVHRFLCQGMLPLDNRRVCF